ncbi:MAG: STAS domain-containing protein [Planctomycetaceae bacterium]|nr:STAS domain-containing protein [Planctomycetaceae bacterium]
MGSLRTQENEGVLVVSFTDTKILDEAKIQKIGSELIAAADAAAAAEKKMVLNFTGVDFMSSAMIGKLVLLNKKCKMDSVDLKLSDICGNVQEVFKIMKLNKVFDIYKTEDKALKAFSKKGWFG